MGRVNTTAMAQAGRSAGSAVPVEAEAGTAVQADAGTAIHAEAVGLRERKKDATRRDLAERALQLAQSRGFDDFTISELVADVGVSRRTFSNYFASKAECVVAVTDGWLDDVLDTIRQAPADASLLSVLQTGLLAVAQGGVERWGALQAVADTEPELQACALAGDESAVDLVCGEIAARSGLSTDDLRVRLLSGFAITAGREVLTRWSAARKLPGAAEGNADLAAMLETAFSIINLDALTTAPAAKPEVAPGSSIAPTSSTTPA